MMNSEVRMVPVAAACDRRRTDPMNPTGRWSVAAFVRTPQIEPVIPTLRPPGQSSLIKPNQAISCFDAIQSQPPSCSKIATSPFLLRQTPSMPVKASQSDSRSLPSGHSSSRRHLALWSPQPNAQPMVVCLCGGRHRGQKSAIRNPQSAIPVDSTQFHLIPPNSTPSPANGRFQSRTQPSRSLHFNPPPPTV
jgi:hypothetical protein